MRQRSIPWREAGDRLATPLETAGVIILITSAGGAYGAMIRHAGVGDAIRVLAAGESINYVVLGWILAVGVRLAQGSGTVAMLTAAGIVASMAGEDGFGVHPL
jgi:GntP family gluconate:H+ symporter